MKRTQAIKLTREWFAQNALDCLEEAESGKVKVNDLKAYRLDCLRRNTEYLAGSADHTLAFRQRVDLLMTGICYPLLP